jgi:hypothetical protein
MFLLVRLLAFTRNFAVLLSCLAVGWLGFLPEVLSGDSPDVRNAIAGLYERYCLAFLSCLNVRAISFSLLF